MDEKKLLDILNELKDYEEASDALLKLRYQNPIATENYCKYALENHIGDLYYMGMVIDILYGLNRNYTLEFTLKSVNNLPEYVIATTLSNVIDDESLVPDSNELQIFVSKMLEYVNHVLVFDKSNDVFSKFMLTFKKYANK